VEKGTLTTVVSRFTRILAASLLAAGGLGCSRSGDDSVAKTGALLQSSQEQKLVSPDPGAAHRFGAAVALSGDSALVGSPGYSFGGAARPGVAFVFTRTPTGWTVTQELSASNYLDDAFFGTELALDGGRALVLANRSDSPTNGNSSVVYAFERNGATFGERQQLFPEQGFFQEIALSGATALLRGRSSGVSGAFEYVHDGTSWVSKSNIPVDGAIALSGDTALVGHRVFVRTSSGWTLQQDLMRDDTPNLGAAVAIDGNTALLSSPPDGGFYVFARTGTSWSLQQVLRPSDGHPGDFVGAALAVAGDLAIVGAPGHEHQFQNENHGSAYLFTRSGAIWTELSELRAADAQNNDFFGLALAISGSSALIGAENDDGAFVAEGSAYVFRFRGALGDPCSAASDCSTGFCSDGRCCEEACDGACNACSIAAGAAREGECTVLPAGSPGSPACAPYACTGASARCEAIATCGPCESDADCLSNEFCNSVAICQPRKANGRACEPVAGGDCRADACRVCASGSCVDGFCCDSPCTGSCSSCAQMLTGVANGTCATRPDCTGTGGAGGAGSGGTGGGASGGAGNGSGGASAGSSGAGAGGAGGGGGIDCFRVAPDGDDLLASESGGTTPFRTITGALDFADAHREISTEICVAAGATCGLSAVYAGPLGADIRMREGINVHGRYASTTWTRCTDADTRVEFEPSTPAGVLFDSVIAESTTLEGVVVRPAFGDVTAGITVDGATGAVIDAVTVRAANFSDTPSFGFGIDVRNGGRLEVRASTIAAPDAETAVALRSVASRVNVTGSELSANTDGVSRAAWFVDSWASTVSDSSLLVASAGSPTAVVIEGSTEDLAITHSEIRVDGSARDAVAVMGSACLGTVAEISESTISVINTATSTSGPPNAAGVVARDCWIRVAHSDIDVSVGGNLSGSSTLTGIDCDANCYLHDNRVTTTSLVTLQGTTVTSKGIVCSSCGELSRNEVAGLRAGGCLRNCNYDSVGMSVVASPIGALVQENRLSPGCAGGPLGGTGIGLAVSGNARVINNVIGGVNCNFPEGGIHGVAVELAGPVDLHSNSIHAGTFSAGLCDGTAVRFGDSAAKIRNTVLDPGTCPLGLSVDQTTPSSAAAFQNNDVVARASGEIGYRIQGATDPRTIESVNALPFASGNFSAPCGFPLVAGSACIDRGVAADAPPTDIEGDARDAAPDVGADEWRAGEACTPRPWIRWHEPYGRNG
jgi:hypothetical protein